MPYSVGQKGSHGCSGYPVIKTKTGEVMGCHPSVEDANKQLAALHINEPDAAKADNPILPTSPASPSSTKDPLYPGVGITRPNGRYAKKPKKRRGGVSGDATGSSGAISSGGSGGSMGAKSDGIWNGSAFAAQGCTPDSPKCLDILCKMCQTKR